ncbi:MAG TPA: hypothetical protein VHJ83_09430 [Micromonosporaceae bacterium]|nr:hypothetical protein [Micromonosporaceae bacterium]
MVEREVTTPVVVLECQAMVSGPGVQAGVTEFLAQSEDQVAHRRAAPWVRRALGRRERGSKAASPSTDTRP